LLLTLLALLVAGPAGLAVSRTGGSHSAPPVTSLSDIARAAGCRLAEFDHDPRSNPPVSGRVDERVYAADGSYVGRRSPSTIAAVHALLHGRVVLQYRRDLPMADIDRLDRLVRPSPSHTLLFANRTGMRDRVVATAYLSMMTCPAVTPRTLRAIRAFRDRRIGFGQAF
jgi:hypothetical protein